MIRLFTRLYAWWFDHFNRAAVERDEADIRTLQHALARQHRHDSWEDER